ncbi:hypothetical protein CBF29_06660 [Vagococcus elongatus]|uniref:Uncharacterized protein n=1 Tax=Vagococcus elongatus TaxID=180344 RepID=A0A430AW57_9ENTE|nr:hypothetical protein CBF29_06660 [Vagococcus elongatus]
MAIKPDFHILARDCGNGKLDWKIIFTHLKKQLMSLEISLMVNGGFLNLNQLKLLKKLMRVTESIMWNQFQTMKCSMEVMGGR